MFAEQDPVVSPGVSTFLVALPGDTGASERGLFCFSCVFPGCAGDHGLGKTVKTSESRDALENESIFL